MTRFIEANPIPLVQRLIGAPVRLFQPSSHRIVECDKDVSFFFQFLQIFFYHSIKSMVAKLFISRVRFEQICPFSVLLFFLNQYQHPYKRLPRLPLTQNSLQATDSEIFHILLFLSL